MIIFSVLCFCIALPASLQAQDAAAKGDTLAAHKLIGSEMIRDWVVIGPFPNQMLDEPLPDGVMHAGYATNFLADLGSEAAAVLTPGVEAESALSPDDSGKVHAQIVKADGRGVLDFEAHYGTIDYAAAYAFATIDADQAQVVNFYFGSDDGAKVWINGELVHQVYTGRGIVIGEDTFKVELKQGRNTVLIKVAERIGAWGFALGVADQEAYKALLAEIEAKELRSRFKGTRVMPAQSYLISPGDFPELVWERPGIVEQVVGEVPLTVRWFDRELNEVTTASTPGRYAFVAQGTTKDGRTIRRAGTVYCKDPNWMEWAEQPTAKLNHLAPMSIDQATLEKHRDAVAGYTGRTLRASIEFKQAGVPLLAFLHDMQADNTPATMSDTPLARDQDYHVALQRKLMGVEDKWPALKLPRQRSGGPAPVLREGTPTQAGVAPDTAAKIQAVCKAWYEKSGEPFVTLVARNGVIIYHEAIGEGPFGKVTTDTAMPLASLTKSITGMAFAQFVDQGLIGIDDPVGMYLPDFPTTGDEVITLRHCFTHTTGLTGHAMWGGIHNPRIENIIANFPQDLAPGKALVYNGMGYDLAGKVMSVVAGKGIIRIMREQMFDPIGADNTVVEEDLGYSCNTTAFELGMLAQMLANHGSYGDLEFFSPETFEKLMPTQLNAFYPDITADWGIGFTPFRPAHPNAGTDGVPPGTMLLGERTIGHGSATACILRVDPDDNLVITQVRRRAGPMYEKFLGQLMLAVDEGIIRDE
jgi:CubicO group peptidase (beta-lactamase class C family)